MATLHQVRAQAQKICDKMSGYGFKNFPQLMSKFSPISGELTSTDASNAKQTKEYMEAILFLVENSPQEKRTELANLFQDRTFLCGPGTVSNLVSIYAEMSLGKQSLDAIVAQTKREVIEQIILPLHRDNVFADKGFASSASMEVHDIASLVNAVADDFGLSKKSKEEDMFIKDASAYHDILSDILNSNFGNSEITKQMAETVARKIALNLPTISDSKENIASDINAYLEQLGIKKAYNLLVEIDNNGKVTSYKNNVESIIIDAVSEYMGEKGIIDSNLEAKRRLELEDCSDINGKTAISKGYLEEKGYSTDLTEADWKYILANGIELDVDEFGIANPFEYAAKNGIKIEGKDPLDYFVENEIPIKGVKAEFYAIEFINLPNDRKTEFLKVVDDSGKTALQHFAANSNIKALKKFLSLQIPNLSNEQLDSLTTEAALVSYKEKNFKPLNVAVDLGNAQLVRHILQTQDEIDLLKDVDYKGRDILKHAAENNNKEVIKAIIKGQYPTLSESSLDSLSTEESIALISKSNKFDIISCAYELSSDVDKTVFKKILRELLPNISDKTFEYIKSPKNMEMISSYVNRSDVIGWIICNSNDIEIIQDFLGTKEGREYLKKTFESELNSPIGKAIENGRKDVLLAILETPEGKAELIGNGERPVKIKKWILENIGKEPILKLIEFQFPSLYKDFTAFLASDDAIDHYIKSYPKSRTPLHYAVAKGEREIVEAMLKTSEGIKILSSPFATNTNPIHLAIDNQNIEILEILLSTKEGLKAFNAVDMYGNNAFHYAVKKDNIPVIEFLLKKNDLLNSLEAKNKRNRTPLHLAAEKGAKEIVEALLKIEQGKASLNIKYSHYNSLIEYLIEKEDYQVIKAIISIPEGRKLLKRCARDGISAVHIAIVLGNEEIFNAIFATEEGRESLKSLRHPLNIYNFSATAEKFSIDIFKSVIDYLIPNLEPKSLDFLISDDAIKAYKRDYNPLSYSIIAGNENLVESILKTKEGRDELLDSGFGSPLDMAINTNNAKIVKLILATEEGKRILLTPAAFQNSRLNAAVYNNQVEIVKVMLETKEGINLYITKPFDVINDEMKIVIKDAFEAFKNNSNLFTDKELAKQALSLLEGRSQGIS